MAVGEYLGNGCPDGSSFGRTTTEKISFYGVTPVAQTNIATAGTDIATVITEIASIRARLVALGLVGS